jgi:hypothetical protein
MSDKDERRDVRAIVRTYFDKEENKDKNVYQTVGTAWVSPHESTITVQLDSVPVGKDWNGKLYINKPYEKKEEKKSEDVILEDIDDSPIDLSEIPF